MGNEKLPYFQKGIIVALLTPLDEDERIDVGSLERLIEWVLSSQVKGLFVGGTVGEGAALRDKEKAVLYREIARIVNSRVPILANVSETGTRRSIEVAGVAAEAGVDGIVTTARMSFPQKTLEESRRHVETISKMSSLPLWFYENPGTTGVSHDLNQLSEIMSLPNVEGLKFSSPDRNLFEECIGRIPGRPPVMTGNVSDIAFSARSGAAGAIAGIGSLAPGLAVRTFESALAGDIENAERLQKSIDSLYSVYMGDGWPLWPSAQKHVLKRLGILRTSISTAPFLQMGEREEAFVDGELERLDQTLFDSY